MASYQDRPWAKKAATAVIIVSILAAIFAAYFRHSQGLLDIPEVAILILLLLAILPPNIAILYRKQDPNPPKAKIDSSRPHAH